MIKSSLVSQLSAVGSDGSIYVFGNNAADLSLTKVDVLGNLVWHKILGSPIERNIPRDILVTSDNKIILASTADGGTFGIYQRTLLLMLDSSGAFVFSKYVGDTLSIQSAYSLFDDSTSFILTMASYGSTDTSKILRFDFSGNLIYERGITNYLSGLENIIRKRNGSYLIYDYYQFELVSLDQNFENPHLIYSSFSSCGDHLLCLTSLNDTAYVGISGDGGIGSIVYFNSNMRGKWCKTFYRYINNHFLNLQFTGLKKLNNGEWYVIGHFDQVGISYSTPIIIHLDSNFNLIRNIKLDFQMRYEQLLLTRSILTQENGLIFSEAGAGNYDSTTFISHVDSTFTAPCSNINDSIVSYIEYSPFLSLGTPTSHVTTTNLTNVNYPINDMAVFYGDCMDSTVSINTYEEMIFKIYPSPSSDKFFIDVKNYNGDSYLIELRDLNQRLIRKIEAKNISDLEVAVSEFHPGMYFVYLFKDAEQVIGKAKLIVAR